MTSVCHYCESECPSMTPYSEVIEHLIVLKSNKGDVHVHGPIENKELMIEFIKSCIREGKLTIQDLK